MSFVDDNNLIFQVNTEGFSSYRLQEKVVR
jgi:hypothetical protein